MRAIGQEMGARIAQRFEAERDPAGRVFPACAGMNRSKEQL
jgi:hypothetical protein